MAELTSSFYDRTFGNDSHYWLSARWLLNRVSSNGSHSQNRSGQVMVSMTRSLGGILAAGCLVTTACSADTAVDASSEGQPTVVVTTNILGDVVEQLVGEAFEVVTVMPVGSDPHSFQPSAQQVNQITQADALIVSGGGFEEGLLDVIESAEAEGVPVFEALSVVKAIDFSEDYEDHDDEGHDDEGHDDHGTGVDPHFFSDPGRMVDAARGLVDFLVVSVDTVDGADLNEAAAPYIAELEALEREVESVLAVVPADRRVLVTNHEVFGYFADRFDFEVVGTVIPSGSTADGASAQALAALADEIARLGVPAIFADTSSSDQLAQTLAAEAGEVAVVELFSESLGAPDSDGATYIQMVRSNADRVAGALAGG